MFYTPKKNNLKYTLTFISGMFLLIVLFLLSHLDIVSELLCQITFFIEAIFYTFLLSKFYLPTYTYILEDERFKIIKAIGNKAITVCDIDYSKITDVISKAEYKKQENSKIKSVYNYSSNIFSSSCYCLVFKYSERFEAVFFEPNDLMVDEIKRIVSLNSVSV